MESWQFFVPFFGKLSDPFKGYISDLQLGDKKVTLKAPIIRFVRLRGTFGGFQTIKFQLTNQIFFHHLGCQFNFISSIISTLTCLKTPKVSPLRKDNYQKCLGEGYVSSQGGYIYLALLLAWSPTKDTNACFSTF